MRDVYNETQKISDLIRKKYNLIEFWQHDLSAEMKRIQVDTIARPYPRDALLGGRTEPFYHLAKTHEGICYDKVLKTGELDDWQRFCEAETYDRTSFDESVSDRCNEIITMLDVVSLYPTVMFYDKYPLGHPVITRYNFPFENNYNVNWFGLVQCTVLPPKGLFIPVLPCKIKTGDTRKLLFGLCRTCMENNQTECSHSDDERKITGFWTTVELNKAIEKGYKVLNVYESWIWPKQTTELFKDYIKCFMKIKMETTDYSGTGGTTGKMTSEKEQLLREKARKIGIELGELKPNEGLRYIAKLCLNSLWGKFCQNPKMRKRLYVKDFMSYLNTIQNEKYENFNIILINDKLVEIEYDEKDVFINEKGRSNVYLGIFTTSHARIRLYNMLDRLGERALYCDSDSVIFTANKEVLQKLEQYIGDSLGDWSYDDKVNGGKNHAICFSSEAPKSYSLVLDNDKETNKVKGIKKTAEFEENLMRLIENGCCLIKMRKLPLNN